MSVNDRVHKRLGGFIFVACMFLGMGIGMLFGRSGAGTLIGMGVGFVIMGLFMSGILKVKTTETVKITIRTSFILTSLIIAGTFFIGIGLGLIFNIKILIRYISGLLCIAVGILLITFGMYIAQYRRIKEESRQY